MSKAVEELVEEARELIPDLRLGEGSEQAVEAVKKSWETPERKQFNDDVMLLYQKYQSLNAEEKLEFGYSYPYEYNLLKYYKNGALYGRIH
jgi:hypothetical protein